MKYYYIILVFLLILLSLTNCKNKISTINKKELTVILKKDMNQYYKTDSLSYLKDAYKGLHKNKDYKNGIVDSKNKQFVYDILRRLKKYDELIDFIKKDTLNKKKKFYYLNYIKFLKYKDINRKKANSYITKNVKRTEDSIQKRPKDSLLYFDYFNEKLFLSGKKEIIKEIDSMQKTNPIFSKDFFEVLKNQIKQTPDSLIH